MWEISKVCFNGTGWYVYICRPRGCGVARLQGNLRTVFFTSSYFMEGFVGDILKYPCPERRKIKREMFGNIQTDQREPRLGHRRVGGESSYSKKPRLAQQNWQGTHNASDAAEGNDHTNIHKNSKELKQYSVIWARPSCHSQKGFCFIAEQQRSRADKALYSCYTTCLFY